MNLLRYGKIKKISAIFLTSILSACGGSDEDIKNDESNQITKSCTQEYLASINVEDVAINSAEIISSGEYKNQKNLPQFCLVTATATKNPQSEINFEILIPEGDSWNGKLVATGNGGYSPALSYSDMAYALRQGYATIGGDTGHKTEDMMWGFKNDEKILDWGTRSINVITVASKKYIEALKGEPASRSYYLGCSTGGHQGFAEAQKYPEDFDGIIAGAPGNNRTALNIEFLWRFMSNRPQGDNSTAYLDNKKLSLLTNTAIQACDSLDGVTDGVIDDPRACTQEKFNVESLLCSGEENDSCLTSQQLDAAKKIYAGPQNPRTNEQLYPGWAVGSESGWGSYMRGSEPTRADFWRYWTFENKDWNWWDFDWDKDVSYAYQKIAPLVDQTSTDLNNFKARGGKMIVYHGWNDPVVSPFDSIKYYEMVKEKQGSQEEMDSFYKLFMIPGMGHCSGGAGITNIRGNGELVSYSKDKDILSALDAWVESNHSPDNFIGSKLTNNSVEKTKPLCAYPKKAVYSGVGDVNSNESYACK